MEFPSSQRSAPAIAPLPHTVTEKLVLAVCVTPPSVRVAVAV